ncbi:DUF6153 family protein [Kitasatospora sp. NPDC051853]|uniref:DUF6153 family protein n=1 Tax=Kitasatospora sp. NPDC051853 TaxID=3364058 RepID=UPI0037A5AC93
MSTSTTDSLTNRHQKDSTVHPEHRRRRAPARVLLVLAALLGVLGMHGLGAVPGSPAAPPAPAVAMAAGEHHGQHGAPGHGDGGGGGHDLHAGPMCLAGAVAAPFVPPPPGPAPSAVPERAACPVGGLTDGQPEGGRAPPDLTELQVLRR